MNFFVFSFVVNWSTWSTELKLVQLRRDKFCFSCCSLKIHQSSQLLWWCVRTTVVVVEHRKLESRCVRERKSSAATTSHRVCASRSFDEKRVSVVVVVANRSLAALDCAHRRTASKARRGETLNHRFTFAAWHGVAPHRIPD